MRNFTFMAIFFSLFFSSIGLRLTLSKFKVLSSMNLLLFVTLTVTNILLGCVLMCFVFYRFRTKGMSENIKR